jgi:hypothetical protein
LFTAFTLFKDYQFEKMSTQDLATWSYESGKFKLTYKNKSMRTFNSIRGVFSNTPHVLKQMLDMGIPRGSDCKMVSKLFEVLKKKYGESSSENEKAVAWDWVRGEDKVVITWEDGTIDDYDPEFFSTCSDFTLLEELMTVKLGRMEENEEEANELEELVRVRVVSWKQHSDLQDEMEFVGYDDGNESFTLGVAGEEFDV